MPGKGDSGLGRRREGDVVVPKGKVKILSVTIHDCEVQTFRAGGNGGQNQNKRDTGVRVIHHPSGARGESREERSQLQNKRKAFVRMTQTVDFRLWLNRQCLSAEEARRLDTKYSTVDENVKVEVRGPSGWEEVSGEG